MYAFLPNNQNNTRLSLNELEVDDVKASSMVCDALQVDNTSPDALVVRQNNLGAEVLRVNTQDGKVTINGDLHVTGNATLTLVDITTIEDPLIELAVNNDADNVDIGFYGRYVEAATTKYTGLYRDSSDANKTFLLVKGVTTAPGVTFPVVGDSQLAPLKAQKLTTTQGVTCDTTTLNSTNFSYLATINQNMGTSDSVIFNNITGVLQTASQPNITTLAGLNSVGGYTMITANWLYLSSLNQDVGIFGHPFWPSVTTDYLTMGGDIDMSGFSVDNCQTLTSNSIYGTVLTSSQPNITSLGGLASIQGQSVASSAWQYVNTMNQAVSTSSSPVFNALRLTAGASNNYVLKSDASGNASWSALSSLGVASLTGTANQVLANGTSGSAQTGAITLTLPQSIGTGSSPTFAGLTNTSNYTCRADTHGAGALHYTLNTTGGSLRWGIGLQNTESSGNAGSNLSIFSYNDAGSYLATPMSINRATSNVQLAGNLRANGQLSINSSPATTTWGTIALSNSIYDGLLVGGTSTDTATDTHYGIFVNTGYKPSSGSNSNYYLGVLNIPTFASTSANTLSGVCACEYLSPSYTGNLGTLSTVAGLYYDGGAALSGGITNNFGGYFAKPAAGSNRYALYSADLAVGNTVVPPTNGLYVHGPCLFNNLSDNTSGNLTSGSYTPTLTVVGGTFSPSLLTAYYDRIGNIVTCYVLMTAGSMGTNTSTLSFTITLPFTRTNNFSNIYEAVGAAVPALGSATTGSGYVSSTMGAKTVLCSMRYSVATSGSQDIHLHFRYTHG